RRRQGNHLQARRADPLRRRGRDGPGPDRGGRAVRPGDPRLEVVPGEGEGQEGVGIDGGQLMARGAGARPVLIFKRRKDLGPLLLGIWLVGMGLTHLLRYSIPFAEPILAVLAIGAGAAIMLNR